MSVLRVCDTCGLIDTAPRHVHWDPAAPKPSAEMVRATAQRTDLPTEVVDQAVKDLLDDFTQRHMDCCAAAGCPDRSCDTILAGAGGAKDDALRAHITGGN